MLKSHWSMSMTEYLNEVQLARRAISSFTGISENTLARWRCFGGAINIGDSLAVAWSLRGGNNSTRTHRTFCCYIFVSFPLNSTRDVWIIDWNTRVVIPIYIPDNNVSLRLKVKMALTWTCSFNANYAKRTVPVIRQNSRSANDIAILTKPELDNRPI